MWKGDVDRERVLIDSSVLCRKAPSLYEDFGKGPPPQKTSDHIHITLITVCCYNRYILLLNVCYLSLCLICNLNFILGMYVGGKTACYIIGLSAICVFSRPLGVLEHVLCRQQGNDGLYLRDGTDWIWWWDIY